MKKQQFLLIGCILLISFSIAAMLYPVVSQAASKKAQVSEIEQHIHAQQTMPAEILDSIVARAEEYNRLLAEGDIPSATDYFDILNAAGNGMMGYLSIPKIGVVLPIYHGTSASVLNKGAGHMEKSSLPVGGSDTHSVLTAHSGMARNPMFSDLPLVGIGDTFTLQVSGRVLEYRVIATQTVLPSESDAIRIQPGRDLCTLITCVPYGINTHRLLVTGERVVCSEDPSVQMQPTEHPNEAAASATGLLSRYLIAMGIGLCISAVLIASVMLFKRRSSAE